MTANSLDVEISIVNHNSYQLLEACLSSLDAACTGLCWHVTVIDNVPRDESVELISTHFPSITLIRNTSCKGFGANHNQTIRQIVRDRRARYILILNPDTKLDPGSVRELVRLSDQCDRIGATGPALVDWNDGRQPSAFRFPSIMTEVASAAILPKWSRSILWSRLVEMRACGSTPAPVDWLLGAALLVRTSALAHIGGFDERFFLYSEETDLALRLRSAGYLSYLCPCATVHHLGGGSTSTTYASTVGISRQRYIKKHWALAHRTSLALALLLVYVWNTMYIVARIVLSPRSVRTKAKLWRAHWNSRVVFRPGSPMT